MEAEPSITTWNPPQRNITQTEHEGLGNVATEWIVEARNGGTCVVRAVHRWFSETDDWEAQSEGHAHGRATSFFRILQLYLANFPGNDCSVFQLSAFSNASGPETWKTTKRALHIDQSSGRITAAANTPELVGNIENLQVNDPDLLRIRQTTSHIAVAFDGMDGENPELLVRLEKPRPGFAHVFIMPMGGTTRVSARFHLFGQLAHDYAPTYQS